jgi:peptidoglycan/xylan/chitin deacetylase (PgdA/CDA1 family)
MKTALRAAGDAALRWSPAQLYFRGTSARRLAVLAYHGVDDPAQFARQLDHLRRHACPVSLDEVVAAARDGLELPPHAVLVTFDDGHRSVLEHGAPLLRERGIPAVAFVITGLLDSDRPFWWVETEALVRNGGSAGDGYPGNDPAAYVRRLKTVPDHERRDVITELRRTADGPADPLPQLTSNELLELEAAGVEVGNHTVSHPCLDQCDAATAATQVREAHEALQAVLGRPPRAFAYPNGNWDARADEVLKEEAYQVAFLFDHRLTPPIPADPLRISRLRVGTTTSLDRFAAIVSGLHPAVHHARGGG